MKADSTGSRIYAEYLKHPEWLRLRLLILERDEFKCRKCGKFANQVHHIKYLPDRKPWEYSQVLLVALCKNCHKQLHWLIENGGDTSEYNF